MSDDSTPLEAASASLPAEEVKTEDVPTLGGVTGGSADALADIEAKGWISQEIEAEVARLREQGARCIVVPVNNMGIYRVCPVLFLLCATYRMFWVSFVVVWWRVAGGRHRHQPRGVRHNVRLFQSYHDLDVRRNLLSCEIRLLLRECRAVHGKTRAVAAAVPVRQGASARKRPIGVGVCEQERPSGQAYDGQRGNGVIASPHGCLGFLLLVVMFPTAQS
jgi:hypothetical protein